MNRPARIAMFLATAFVGASFTGPDSEAGDRELSVLFVNMTPDALSDDASKACVKQIEKVIAADYSTVKRLGETKLRKLAGYPTKGDSFLDWRASSLKKPKEYKEAYHDTVVLVDCRPAAQSIDVMVSPPSDGVSRMKIRNMQINKKLTKWVGRSVLRRAWNGFSP